MLWLYFLLAINPICASQVGVVNDLIAADGTGASPFPHNLNVALVAVGDDDKEEFNGRPSLLVKAAKAKNYRVFYQILSQLDHSINYSEQKVDFIYALLTNNFESVKSQVTLWKEIISPMRLSSISIEKK